MKQMVALGTKLKSSVSKVGWGFPETERGVVMKSYWLVNTEFQFCKMNSALEIDAYDGCVR